MAQNNVCHVCTGIWGEVPVMHTCVGSSAWACGKQYLVYPWVGSSVRHACMEHGEQCPSCMVGHVGTVCHVCPGRGGSTLLRNPLRTCEALTERNRGIRMGFSRITVGTYVVVIRG